MSKYFDKLVQINESLTKELKDKGLIMEEDEETSVPVPADSLTDDQKKEILTSKDVDKKLVDGMSPEEMDGALKIVNNDDQQNESSDDGEVYLRMDDDDLDIHGYVKMDVAEKVDFVDSEAEADVFASRQEAEELMKDICDRFNYDPSTFTFQDVKSQVADDGENWVSIDSSNPSATVIP